jgi:nicotinamidase/pyrazinamidase
MIEILFCDVDTQHDFMDADGALPVPEADAIVPNLRRLTEAAVASGTPIVASADAHPPDDPEFEQFGPHCVAGTPGQAKIDATTAPGWEVADADRLGSQAERLAAGELPQLVIEKQDLDVFTEPAADRLLRLLRPARVYVYGVTTEYCVLRAVRGLLDRGWAATVVTDAVKAIDSEEGGRALEEMTKAGVETAGTEDALSALREATE